MSYPEQQMQNYIEAGISEADRCYARIAELKEQNAALAAQVEAFGTLIHEAINGESAEPIATDGQITGYAVSYEWLDKVGAAIELPPQQHLAEIRAQAGLKGYKACLRHIGYDDPDWQHDANQYADSVRQGGAE